MAERSNGDKIGACEKSSTQTLAEPRVGSLVLLAGSPFGTKETPDEQHGIRCLPSALPLPTVLGASSGAVSRARLQPFQGSLSAVLSC